MPDQQESSISNVVTTLQDTDLIRVVAGGDTGNITKANLISTLGIVPSLDEYAKVHSVHRRVARGVNNGVVLIIGDSLPNRVGTQFDREREYQKQIYLDLGFEEVYFLGESGLDFDDWQANTSTDPDSKMSTAIELLEGVDGKNTLIRFQMGFDAAKTGTWEASARDYAYFADAITESVSAINAFIAAGASEAGICFESTNATAYLDFDEFSLRAARDICDQTGIALVDNVSSTNWTKTRLDPPATIYDNAFYETADILHLAPSGLRLAFHSSLAQTLPSDLYELVTTYGYGDDTEPKTALQPAQTPINDGWRNDFDAGTGFLRNNGNTDARSFALRRVNADEFWEVWVDPSAPSAQTRILLLVDNTSHYQDIIWDQTDFELNRSTGTYVIQIPETVTHIAMPISNDGPAFDTWFSSNPNGIRLRPFIPRVKYLMDMRMMHLGFENPFKTLPAVQETAIVWDFESVLTDTKKEDYPFIIDGYETILGSSVFSSVTVDGVAYVEGQIVTTKQEVVLTVVGNGVVNMLIYKV